MTYDNLVADVINYMERNDEQFVAQIPSLIGLAESAIAAELKTYLQLTLIAHSYDCQSSVGYDAVYECVMWVILPDVKGDSHAVEIQIHHSQSL